MKTCSTLFSILLLFVLILLSGGCSGSKDAIRQKDNEIGRLNDRIRSLENNNNELEQQNTRFRDRADDAEKRANDLEIQSIELKKAQLQKRRASAQTYLAQAKSECVRAGDSFKRNDYQDINEHAARVLAAVTAISALTELDDAPNPALTTALAEAKKEAEGLIEASGKKQHNDSHDHHEHLCGKLATIETLLN